jgi:biotin carboxyl carrier protein
MPGVIVSVTKKIGEKIIAGEPILVLEAMKMENEIRAPVGGTLLEVKVSPGQRVDKGETLVVIE